MPVAADRNIKIPTTQNDDFVDDANLDDVVDNDRDKHRRDSAVGRRPKPPKSDLHIIYDSQRQDSVPYPDADYVRSPSPEHVGIPAGPLRIPVRKKQSGAEDYTSDESNEGGSRSRLRHPPQNRRKKSVQQI